MNESPALAGVHTVDDIDAADDFHKKHVPYIGVERDGDVVKITIEVGHYAPHPNLPDHWIELISVFANGAPIASYDLAAGVIAPKITVEAMLDPGTEIAVFERCNLHGSWAAETTV